MRILLDTSALVALERQTPHAVKGIKAFIEEELAVSTVTAAEFLVGKHLVSKPEHRKRIEEIANRFAWMPFEEAAALKAAEIIAFRRKKGRLVGFQDDAIAATALSWQADLLITENKKHFSDIPELKGKVKSFAELG